MFLAIFATREMPKYDEHLIGNKMLTANTSLRALDGRNVNIREDLGIKASRVLAELRSCSRVLVAFSGGIDSTLITYMAKLALGRGVVAVTANSPSLASLELEETKKLATLMQVEHKIIQTDELNDPNYTSNPTNRCYFCKQKLGEKLIQLANELGGYAIVDGTNAEDLQGHRPGAAALTEKGIRRPLAEAGMSKEEVRELAKVLGLPNFDKPSMPCLSSRVAYGEIISPERLLRIERSENLIRSLTNVKELRVRDHGSIARIEVGGDERKLFFNEDLLDKISEALRSFGFVHVAFDVTGYQSGSLNQTSATVRDGKK
jgi:uncharacterized protein